MNCSTNNALVSIIENIQTPLDDRKYVARVFVDLKKVFDTVDQMISVRNKPLFYDILVSSTKEHAAINLNGV